MDGTVKCDRPSGGPTFTWFLVVRGNVRWGRVSGQRLPTKLGPAIAPELLSTFRTFHPLKIHPLDHPA
jgi:hypothetical protein